MAIDRYGSFDFNLVTDVQGYGTAVHVTFVFLFEFSNNRNEVSTRFV